MDYGHELLFGTFITPAAQPPHHAVELAVVADRAGLDLVTAFLSRGRAERAITEQQVFGRQALAPSVPGGEVVD